MEKKKLLRFGFVFSSAASPPLLLTFSVPPAHVTSNFSSHFIEALNEAIDVRYENLLNYSLPKRNVIFALLGIRNDDGQWLCGKIVSRINNSRAERLSWPRAALSYFMFISLSCSRHIRLLRCAFQNRFKQQAYQLPTHTLHVCTLHSNFVQLKQQKHLIHTRRE